MSDLQICRLERARFCTSYLEKFDESVRRWADLAEILVEVQEDMLYLEVGEDTWDSWLQKHAPVSASGCYKIKARYERLLEAGVPKALLSEWKPDSAEWASRASNISPAALSDPSVQEALKLPLAQAVKTLKTSMPEQHLEQPKKLICNCTESQQTAILDGHEAFKRLIDEKASLADYLEYLNSEWLESNYDHNGMTARVGDVWGQMKGVIQVTPLEG
jgi:hypothetical protein